MSIRGEDNNSLACTCPITPPSMRSPRNCPSTRKRQQHAATPRRRTFERNSYSNSNFASKTAPASPRHSMYRNKSYSGCFETSNQSFLPNYSRKMQDYKQRALMQLPLDDVDDEEVFEEIISNLQYERKKLAARKAYSECQNYSNAIEYIRELEKKMTLEGKSAFARTLKEEAAEKNEADLNSFDAETEEMIRELDMKIKEEREALEKRHEEEIIAHNEEWLTKKTLEYEHPCGALLDIKVKLNYLIKQGRYEEASSMQKEVDSLKERDEAKKSEKRQEAFNNSLIALMNRQKVFSDELERQADIKRMTLITKRKIARDHLVKRQNKVAIPSMKRSGSFERTSTYRSGIPSSPLVPHTKITDSCDLKESHRLKLPQLDTKQAMSGRRSIRY